MPEVTIVDSETLIVIYTGNENSGGGLVWNDATANTTLLAGNAYKADSASEITFAFTGAGIFGNQIKVQGYGLGGFHITIPDGITVRIAGSPSIVSGFIDSQFAESDSILLTCLVDNSVWVAEMFGCSPNLL